MEQPQFFSRQVRVARRFYLDLLPDLSHPLLVVCGGREECSPDYTIDRDSFPYYSIEFVSRGRGTLWLTDREYPLASGSVFTYGPGISHKIIADQSDPFTKYFVDFVCQDKQIFSGEHGFQLGTAQQISLPLTLQRSLDDLISHGVGGGSSSSKLCSALMRYILLLVATTASPSTTSITPAYSTYLLCREQIEQHFLRLHSLDDLVQLCFIDKAYLCRLFKRFDNQTPYQYITRLKMNHAAELLENPELLIKQVAGEIGFIDVFHFSKTFKRIFGLSPKEFRKLRLHH